MSNPTDIVNIFQETIGGTTESIKNAEKTLQKLHKDQNFVPSLVLIVKQINLSVAIRKSAAVYTKKYAKSLITQKDNQRLTQLAEILLHQLSDTKTDFSLRRHLSTTLQFILINDQKCIIRNILNPICIQLLEASKTDPNTNYEFLGFFVQVLMSSFVHLTKQLNAFIQSTLSTFSQLNLKIFNFAIQAVHEENKANIMNIFRILKIYSYTMKTYIKKVLLAELQTAKLLYDENLAMLLSTSLDYNLKNNQLSTSLIFYNKDADPEVIQLFHSIKADYVQGVCHLMRVIIMHFKDKQMITAHIILNSPSLIPSIINALNEIFSKTSYYRIKSPNLIKLIEELISVLIVAVKNMFYFQNFMEHKKVMFEGVILKILGFSPADCQILSDDPDEFINQLLQIIQMESNKSTRAQPVFDDKNDEVEQYSNLRTLAAVLLELFCKNIDGSLPQIINYSLGVLRNQIQSQFPTPLLLLLLSILRDQILQRQNQGNQIITTVCQILKTKNIPPRIIPQEKTSLEVYSANIEYLLILLTLYRYLSKTPDVVQEELVLICEVVVSLLSREDVSSALQYSSFDLVIVLCERQNQFEPKFIKILLQLLIQDKNRIKCLQNLANIITTTNKELEPYPQLIMDTVRLLTKIVISEAEKKNLIDQLLVNKCCSVITHICQNQVFIPKLIPDIEQAMMPLLVYIDGKNSFDFEEDILMMMSSFIQKSGVVTQNQLIMFEIIPRLFYSQYEFLFGHAFQTLQIFIFYGSGILSSAPQAIKAIIDMAVTNMNTIEVKKSTRNEAENTDGVLIIQSLILSCGSSFTKQNWIQITQAITKRLQNPPVKSHILHSNILATLALILTVGNKAFTNEDCDILLNRVLQNHYCFVVQYSIKVAIIAFSELLGLYGLPFISNRFTYLLDTTITLLEAYEKKQIFNKNPITQIERDYQVSVTTIKNAIVNMNQLENFKNKIRMIKQQNFNFLQKAINELSENKAAFLKEILSVAKVKDETRKIFKIKK